MPLRTRTHRALIAHHAVGIILATALALLPHTSAAQAFPSLSSARFLQATITHVADGDILTARTKESTKLRIRLAGIDAPEIPHGTTPGQPFGNDATRFMAHLVLGKTVTVAVLGVDRYK